MLRAIPAEKTLCEKKNKLTVTLPYKMDTYYFLNNVQ